ncbi:MAG: ribosome assembly RNA-binding protein YhbY [Mobilitalea sp.]
MTTKQRAYLKSLAMTIDAIYQIGKSALTPEITQGVADALEARELIKINVLKSCANEPKELAQILSERTHSEIVQVIGKKIVLYRESKDKKKIVLPVEKKSKSKEIE